MGCHFLLQGIFPAQGSNPCPLHCKVDSQPLHDRGSPRPFYSVLLKTHLQGRSPSSLSCLTMPQVCVLLYLKSFLSCGRRTFSACLKRSAGDCCSNPQHYPACSVHKHFPPFGAFAFLQLGSLRLRCSELLDMSGNWVLRKGLSVRSCKLFHYLCSCPLKHPMFIHLTIHPPVVLPAAAAKSLQSCPTLCNPIDGSPPGSPVPGILQARTLEWVAISFSCSAP